MHPSEHLTARSQNATLPDTHVTFNLMLREQVRFPEERSGTIKNFWVEAETGEVRFVQVDVGGWLAVDDVLIATTRLSRPATPGDPWLLEMTEAQLAQAPRWADSAALDFAAWPPVMVGPFGNAMSLPLLSAQMHANTPTATPSATSQAAFLTRPLEPMAGLLERPVFARDGELGAVADLWMQAETWTMDHLVIETPGPSDPIVVPFKAVRHRGASDGHIVLAGARADYSPQHIGAA